jgi:predicted ferric reductase
MDRRIPLFVLAIVAAMTGGMALRLSDTGQAPWLISRASGLAAFVLVSVSMVFGLLISTKAADGAMSRLTVFTVHQFLSVLSLAFIAVHGGALLFDGFFHFTIFDLVVPFIGPYQPLMVGLGVISAWLAAGVTGSFWARKWIGQKAWRKLHYASFLAYVLSLVHGITSGTDTEKLPVTMLYVVSLTTVLALLAYRIGRSGSKRATARPMAERVAA